MKNLIDKLFQCLFIVGFAAIVVTGLVITLPKYRQAKGLEVARVELQHRIDLKKKEIAEVKGISESLARAVAAHFQGREKGEETV